MKQKKLVLKQSVKDYMMLVLAVILLFCGFQMMRYRSHQIDNQLEQQKMTESVAVNQSK